MARQGKAIVNSTQETVPTHSRIVNIGSKAITLHLPSQEEEAARQMYAVFFVASKKRSSHQ